MFTKRYVSLVMALVLTILSAPNAFAQANGPYAIDWWAIVSSGGPRSGGDYKLNGAVGQPQTDSFSSGDYSLISGFWGYAGAAPPTDPIDLVANRLEVTQAIQDLNNSVRLVAGKRTFVRFHVSANKGAYPSFARLQVQSDGKPPIWISPINPSAGHINVRHQPARAFLNDAFLFELPTNYVVGSVTLTAEVNPETPWRSRSPQESNLANNSVSTAVLFESVPEVNLVVYGVGYAQPQILPAQLHYDHLTSWLRRAFPIRTLRVQERTLFQGHILSNCRSINALLERVRLQDVVQNRLPANTRSYGMVDDRGTLLSTSCASGIPSGVASGATGRPGAAYNSSWDTDDSYGDFLGGHELGHAFGRFHAEFCGAGGGRPFPHPQGRISPSLTGNNAIYGFDIDNRTIYGPDWKDVMSYCTHNWVSDFTYEGLLDFFQQGAPLNAAARRSLDQTDRLLVVGTIDTATNQAELQPMFVLPDAGDIKERVSGDYTIVLRGADGAELARYPFTPIEIHERPAQPTGTEGSHADTGLLISELVPYIAGTVRVDIEGPGGLLTGVTAGPATPTIRITAPNGGEQVGGETVTVAWEASDPDGDPLTFNVQYSPDGGARWEMVALNVTATTIELDTANIVGGATALFRVWASDSIHTASDQSDNVFNVPNHLPEVTILRPADNTMIALGQTLALAGSAYDVDTGTMSGDQVKWYSNLDGELGQGDQISIVNLRVGVHTITVEANDGVGGVATDTVQVTVVADPTQLPAVPNALAAGPTAVTLIPATGVVSATISVDNANSLAVINWSAVSSAPWLVVETGSGQTPGQLIIRLPDPASILNNRSATVTLTSPEAPGSSVVIQVSVLGEQGNGLPHKQFLPLIER